MRSFTFVALLLVCLPGRAAAQPASSPPRPSPSGAPHAEPAATTVRGPRRDPAIALVLSLGGTAAAWSLTLAAANRREDSTALLATGVAGTFIAPSLGHIYAGAPLTRGLGVRLLGAAVTLVGYYIVVNPEDTGRGEVRPNLGALPVVFVGAALYVAGSVDDIVRAPLRVKRQNRLLDSVGLAPVVRSHSAGLVVGGRF
jgi:hypothetical protein